MKVSSIALSFLGFLIAVAAVVSGWYFTKYVSYKESKSELEAKITQFQEKIDSADEIEKEIEDLKAEKEKLLAELETLKKQLPQNLQLDVIITKLENIVLAHKMDLNEIRLDNLLEYEGYAELPIEIAVTGDFMGDSVDDQKGLIKLLRDLEQDKLFNVDVGTVRVAVQNAQPGAKPTITASISMKTYVVRGEE